MSSRFGRHLRGNVVAYLRCVSSAHKHLARCLAVTSLALAGWGTPASAAPVGTQDLNCVGGTNEGFQTFQGSGAAVAAQTFTAGSSGKLLYADLKGISRLSGGTGGNINVEVLGTSSGVPGGAPLATAAISGASITADGFRHDYEVTFNPATAAYLTQGTVYALGLGTADSASNSWQVQSNVCPGSIYISTGGPFFQFSWVDEDGGFTTYLGPDNDDYSRPVTLQGASDSDQGTTAGGTRETSEPDHYVTNPPDSDTWVGDHSVWYRWVAPRSGETVVDVCTAAIDSILAVYEGGASTAFGNLTRVVDNNNDGVHCPPGSFGSYATFNATADTEYRIAVGDAGGARESTFTIALDGPPNELPSITPLTPTPGSTTRKRRPPIKASVSDGTTDLAAADIQLKVDDVLRPTFSYDEGTDQLSFRKRMRPGRHTVDITATDAENGTASQSWAFRVKRR